MKYSAWGQESVRISVKAGVCLSHFFMRFAGGGGEGAGSCPHQRGVRNSKVSARRE